MLILRTLLLGPLHGHGIAHSIQRTSDDVLLVRRKWIIVEWGTSEHT